MDDTERSVKSQDQQLAEANAPNLTGDARAESGEGPKKRHERFAGWLGESPVVQIVTIIGEAAAIVSVIVAAFTYFAEAPERTKEKHYQAWQAINTAEGQGGSGGRVEALEDLNSDKQSLAGVSVQNAFLQGVDLAGAELDNANLSGATISGAILRDASLRNADLRDSNAGDSASDDIRKADLRGINLREADVRGADLSGVNLQGAKLDSADLNGAVLDNAQLQEASLKDTILQNARLAGANLKNADFQGANLYYANLSGANLRGAKNLTQEQIDLTFGNGDTQVPEGLQVPPNWKTSAGQLSEVGPLPPGDYSTVSFDAPFSLRVGEGWAVEGGDTDTGLELSLQGSHYGMLFTAPKQVYDPQNLSAANVKPLPKDMVGWLRDHPYLQPVGKPIEANVGGVTATQFVVRIPTMPQDYPTELCEQPCLPIFVNDPYGNALRLYLGSWGVLVLTVNSQTVVIFYDYVGSVPTEVVEVLKTIEWKEN